jgi:hypothetical protein
VNVCSSTLLLLILYIYFYDEQIERKRRMMDGNCDNVRGKDQIDVPSTTINIIGESESELSQLNNKKQVMRSVHEVELFQIETHDCCHKTNFSTHDLLNIMTR